MGEVHLLARRDGPAYLRGQSFGAYLDDIRGKHPLLAQLVDETSADGLDIYVKAMNRLSWEFEGDAVGGRGQAYNAAQMVVENRAKGMTRLLSLFGQNDVMPGPETIILDALAGDGTISRFAWLLEKAPTIISADISALMVQACLDQRLPCIRQSAAKSLLKDGVLDGILIAYGSHHLGREDRKAAAIEAKRTLRPGGKFVLHDFETGGPVDAFFGEVVHPYSATGHPHPHFSRAEMVDLMRDAGFGEISVFDMHDPFELPGLSAAGARTAMLAHIWHMYGLVKLDIDTASGRADLAARIQNTLGPINVSQTERGWTAHVTRTALVAVGTA